MARSQLAEDDVPDRNCHQVAGDRLRHLKPERLVTDEKDLFCSGGMNAGTDLAMYLVEKYCGHEIALQSSKTMISDIGRTMQAPYSIFQFQKDHQDARILAVQKLMEDHFDHAVELEQTLKERGKTAELDIDQCFECGLCAAVCTARRPLLQYIRLAKAGLEDGA